MGQYFKPILLEADKKTPKAFMYTHDYGNGLKLMEHSWMKNSFVRTFESLILSKPTNVVWGGDYAEKEPDSDKTLYTICSESEDTKKSLKINPEIVNKQIRYVVNHDKKQFVDKSKVPDVDGWKIHPLPLLTCEGNGQGGGDYFGTDNQNLVGSWARDLISVETKKPKGYIEISFDLIES